MITTPPLFNDRHVHGHVCIKMNLMAPLVNIAETVVAHMQRELSICNNCDQEIKWIFVIIGKDRVMNILDKYM